MRVTANIGLRNSMRELNSSLERLQEAQRKLSTGQAYERISDDPRAATDVLFLRGRLQRHEQTIRTTEDTKARLQLADTTLTSASDSLIRANELAVRAANTGASGDDGRQAIAEEVRALRSELLSAANTQYLGRSIFAGTAAGQAYDDNGLYNGDDVVEFRTVAQSVQVPGNLTGEQIFGEQAAASGDLFA
ncbi:MAG: flagellar hook-associated protein FlgL, partial [Actinomycetota bacterium]